MEEAVHPRIQRERTTIEQMISLYCKEQHGSLRDELCCDCQELNDYALARLQRCPFQERKSTCAKCTVHCYKPAMRERIRQVMRYSGPKMLRHHPVLAIMHLVDGFRRPPLLPKNGNKQ